MTMTSTQTSTLFVSRPGGQIAFDVQGEGPLVICVPGMGDVRSSYRFLVPTSSPPATGSPPWTSAVMARAARRSTRTTMWRRRPTSLLSSSTSAVEPPSSATQWLRVRPSRGCRPAELLERLVLVGPFVRNVPMPPGMGLVFRLALLRPWGPRFWRTWHRKLFPTRVPDDYDTYRAGPVCFADPTRSLASRATDGADVPPTCRGPAWTRARASTGRYGLFRPRLQGP